MDEARGRRMASDPPATDPPAIDPRSGDATPDLPMAVGGVAAWLLAAGYVAIMPLFAAVGAPPVGAEARLAYHASAGVAWWAIVALSIATDLLFIPVAIGLHRALRPIEDAGAALASAFILLFVVLDLAVTWPAYAALIALGEQYATASTAIDRSLLVAAGGYPAAILGSPLQAVDSVLTLSVGILVAGITMLVARRRGTADDPPPTFTASTAVSGIATGVAGILSVAQTAVTGDVSPLVIAASLLTIVWLLSLGRDLTRRRIHRPTDRRD